jgi:phage gp36-like protein
MPYANALDLETRFGLEELIQLTDRAFAGTPDMGVVEAALADASQLIDGYLAGRYTLPLSETPAPIKRACCDISRHYLHGNGAPEDVRRAYDDAVSLLRAVAAGKYRLPIPSTGQEPAASLTGETTVLAVPGTPQFNDLGGF